MQKEGGEWVGGGGVGEKETEIETEIETHRKDGQQPGGQGDVAEADGKGVEIDEQQQEEG